ncbi:3-oxoadipate enol-lactonase 2 [wastewater metagenome]|uniref:3-oxoadipate enol-lactonase 2 n=4 Tax=root TaxID=1 RepID=A0A5B8RJ09_9ZZZZ|nr:alpha/beta fold hydrolase [Arhodomonas aquaeolei]QEA07712.1 3-oxoadipate enol-lactonase 2 [uncultured organism]
MHAVNGKQLLVEEHGDGEAVIMVHGLGGDSNAWGPQANMLSRHFRVIRPDLEGSGLSPCTGELSIDGFVDDLLALADSLGVERAHWVGHSMGTIVCQHIAARHPERTASLALMGPILEPPEAARKGIRDRAAAARDNGMIPIADALYQGSLAADTRAHQPAVAAFVRELVMRQAPEGYARTCEALAAAQAADLGAIGCPTLLVTGDEDGVAPPTAARDMAKRIAGAHLEILHRCGHWTPLERANEVNHALLNLYFHNHA